MTVGFSQKGTELIPFLNEAFSNILERNEDLRSPTHFICSLVERQQLHPGRLYFQGIRSTHWAGHPACDHKRFALSLTDFRWFRPGGWRRLSNYRPEEGTDKEAAGRHGVGSLFASSAKRGPPPDKTHPD